MLQITFAFQIEKMRILHDKITSTFFNIHNKLHEVINHVAWIAKVENPKNPVLAIKSVTLIGFRFHLLTA